jgi:hypothetical protein
MGGAAITVFYADTIGGSKVESRFAKSNGYPGPSTTQPDVSTYEITSG